METDQHEEGGRATGDRPRRGQRVRLCWFPFCEGVAVGEAVLLCRDRRAVVQACELHAGRTVRANFTTNPTGARR